MVEDGEVGREHHRDLGDAEGVRRLVGHPLPAPHRVVADGPDHPAGQRRQALDGLGGQRGHRVPQRLDGVAARGDADRRLADPHGLPVLLGQRRPAGGAHDGVARPDPAVLGGLEEEGARPVPGQLAVDPDGGLGIRHEAAHDGDDPPVPGAGPGPAGHPRRAPPHGRRRDAGRGLPQAGRRPPGHLPPRVGRARRGLVALVDRRRRQPARPSPSATARRTGSASRRSACPPTGDPLDALRDTMAALATEPIAGLPPLTGGMVGAITYDAVRRWERVPDDGPRRARPARARPDARHRPRRARPHRRLDPARRQRGQLRRHRRAGRATPGPMPWRGSTR